MSTDLHTLPDLPALRQLARALWHNGSIRGAALMIGAGFSKNADRQASDTQEAPNWNELLDELVGQLYPTDRSSAPQDPLRIAEEYRIYFGQATLDGFIRTRFPDRGWLPGPLHVQALNFPWSDILTTNWDTLLERTSDRITDFIYEVVRTEADIAYARSPRIVKLHGTLGDKDPLIFATEDYRTYPVRHAAFVNLARQIFIENDLCLLGFSGNDPNFLQWAGWVRDQLGGHARRIYLAGYLNLAVPARKYLEAHNIAPIDLAPLVGHLPTQERYRAATKVFLDALRAEQPPAPHEWKRHAFNDYPEGKGEQHFYDKIRKDDAFAAETLRETARLLRDDREGYPGWLICPRQERRVLASNFNERAIFKPTVLALVDSSERAEILGEFLWRYTISFSDLPSLFRDALVAIMDQSHPPIDRKARLKFAVALTRDARIKGDDGNLEKWRLVIDTEAPPDAPERLEAHYQQCLRLRDQYNLAELAKSLNGLDSESPLWCLRQAGLYAEVGEYVRATKLITDATAEFEKTYRLNRNSMWIKSCLAWASWLNQVADMANFRARDELLRAREFLNDKIDPADELEALKNGADGERRKEQEDEAAIIPLFDAGSYRPGKAKRQAEPNDPGFSYLYEIDRLIECTGVPLRINDVQVAAGAAGSISRLTYNHSVGWYIWLLRSLHSHFDNLSARYFSRIVVAQLPQGVAYELRQKMYAAISFWRNRYSQSFGEEFTKNRSIARDELRLALWVQSRMTVRMSAEEAAQALQTAIQIVEDSTMSHLWIVEAAGELAKYALQSIPIDRRGLVVFDLLKISLTIESGYPLRAWSETIDTIGEIKPNRDNQDPRWDQLIQELLAAVRLSGNGRIQATNRLAYLARRDVLKPNERDGLAVALWSKTDDNSESLPFETGLLLSAIADLPAPTGIDPIARVKARIFGGDFRDVMSCAGPLDTRVLSEKENHLISIYNMGPMGLLPPAERATELFDQIVAWVPTPIFEGDGFGAGFKQQFNKFVGKWAGEVLTFAVVTAMADRDRNESRLSALLEFIDRAKSWRAVPALPNFLETVPKAQDRIISVINRGLSVAEYLQISGATTAMTRWSLLKRTQGLPGVPKRLIHQLLSMIESQREEGLHILLNAATTLVTDGTLIEEDIVRLVHSLSVLHEDTRYSDVHFDSRRAASISLVRQQCVGLAQALKEKTLDDGILDRWLEEGRSDPLPEVRFSVKTA